jgi:hypothetical protein
VGYDLEKAFEDRIIGGPGAFVVTAEDRESFGFAVRRKLILEIADLQPADTRHAASDPDLAAPATHAHAR